MEDVKNKPLWFPRVCVCVYGKVSGEVTPGNTNTAYWTVSGLIRGEENAAGIGSGSIHLIAENSTLITENDWWIGYWSREWRTPVVAGWPTGWRLSMYDNGRTSDAEEHTDNGEAVVG